MRNRLFLIAAASILAAGCEDNRGEGDAGQTSAGVAESVPTPGGGERPGCEGLPGSEELKEMLKKAPEGEQIGGLAGGRMQWGAIVNRSGELCSVAVATDDPSAAWPGSQGIAIAKASTANAFSTDEEPMSTARLYTMSQPGRSLWGAGAGNPLNVKCLGTPDDPGSGIGEVCGGTITFGGGLALYREQTRIGGLGVSGDTSCADHEVAKRVRTAAGLNPAKGAFIDDIQYSSKDGASVFTHPLCPNTWRNGEKIGEAPPAQGY